MRKIIFILITSSLVLGCDITKLETKNIKVPSISGFYGIPVGEGTYTLDEIIERTTGDSLDLRKDENTSLLTLFSYDTINYRFKGQDFVEIVNINKRGSFEINQNVIGPTATPIVIDTSFTFHYDPVKGEDLDSLFYRTGNVSITTNSSIMGDISYTYTFVNTLNIDTKEPLRLQGSLTDRGSEVIAGSLINHKTILTDPLGANTFTVNLELSISLAVGQSLLTSNELLFNIIYSNQSFNIIYGKFGQDEIQIADRHWELDFFSQTSRKGVFFGNPMLNFDVKNSFGVPIALDFVNLGADDGRGGNKILIMGSLVESEPIVLGSDVSTPTPNNPGDTVQKFIEFNKQNSNIRTIINTNPERFLFNIRGKTNPSNSNTINYLQPEISNIIIVAEMELPMEVLLRNAIEERRFKLDDITNIENVDSAFIRVTTINGFPFDGVLEIELQDADSMTLYRLENLSELLEIPFINIDGEVVEPIRSMTDIPISKEAIDILPNVSFITVNIILNTPKSVTSRDIYVKILADYTLKIKMGMGLKINVEY